MSVADDIKAARDLLTERGRAIGVGEDGDGRVCLSKAVGLVTCMADMEERVLPVFDSLSLHIPLLPMEAANGMRHGFAHGRITEFNDISTDEQVFALIDKALADLGALG